MSPEPRLHCLQQASPDPIRLRFSRITERSDVQPQYLRKEQWLCLLEVVNMTGVPRLSPPRSSEDS